MTRCTIIPLILLFSLLLAGCGGGSGGGSTSPLPSGPLQINELLASNDASTVDPDFGTYADWIELYNRGDDTLDLSGYGLADSDNGASWLFPAGTQIGPKAYLLVWADANNSATLLHTDFKLNANGDTLVLYDPEGSIIDEVTFDEQFSDISYARAANGTFKRSLTLTPGEENSILEAVQSAKPDVSHPAGVYASAFTLSLSAAQGAAIYYTLDGSKPDTTSTRYTAPFTVSAYTELRAVALEPETGKLLSKIKDETYIVNEALVINELMADNQSSYSDETGAYGDWIELYNGGAAAFDLSGYGLADSKNGATWTFPAGTTLLSGAYLLVWADERNTTTHTDFKLSASGDSVVLYNAAGTIIDRVAFDSLYPDVSYARKSDGGFAQSYQVTPLAANVIGEVSQSAKPDFSPAEGVYASAQSVTLGAQNGAAIYYTLDGSTPDTSSALYSGPLSVTETTQIKAVALDPQAGKQLSSVESVRFVINNGVIISELLASNVSTNTDPEFNLYGDWIELHNTLSSSIDISGYGLSDSKNGATWHFPSGTVLGADAKLLVWADDMNQTSTLHTDFKLSSKGDKAVLYDTAGSMIDLVEYDELADDVALRRKSLNETVTGTPTPGQ